MSGIVIVRDVAIIVLALESIIIGFLLIVLVWQVRSLAKLLQTEVKPLLDSVNETARTVKGTTAFLSDNVAAPLIRAASIAAGVNRAVRTFRERSQPSSKGKA